MDPQVEKKMQHLPNYESITDIKPMHMLLKHMRHMQLKIQHFIHMLWRQQYIREAIIIYLQPLDLTGTQ